MSNLGDVLAKKMKQMGISRQVEAVGVVEAATAEIAKFISREDFEVISFKNGVLKIYTYSSAAASQIQLNKSRIQKIIGPKGRFQFTSDRNEGKD